MIPTTPYLVRAIYEWCTDQGLTPHILVDTSVEGVVVPRQLVENDSIMLNIQPSAVRSLELGNEWVLFNARFSGQAVDISVPISAIRAIFARENGMGCAFEAPQEPTDPNDPGTPESNEADKKEESSSGGSDKPHLKLV